MNQETWGETTSQTQHPHPSRPNLEIENQIRDLGSQIIAGVDEAGRGAWAGPVVAAAVILPAIWNSQIGINDSKQLTPLQRETLFKKINKLAEATGIGIAEISEVDKLGVAQASYVAMQRAVDNLKITPQYILVDGYKVNFTGLPSTGIIDGDQKSLSIAAASIIAKVARDRLMVEAHKKYPRFGFGIHKGYGTQLHQDRIHKHGICSLHRKSFAPVRETLQPRPKTDQAIFDE